MKKVISAVALTVAASFAGAADFGVYGGRNMGSENNLVGVSVGQSFGKIGVQATADRSTTQRTDVNRYTASASYDVIKLGPVQTNVRAGVAFIDPQSPRTSNGGAGFVGHHMIEYFLKHTDYDIVSLDRLDTSGNLNRLADILKNNKESHRVKIVWHDLKAPLNDFVINDIGENVKYIFHVAAASHVDRSISRPIEFVQDNVLGTANILEYVRNFCNDIKMFLYFSTDEVFGPAPNGVQFSYNDRFACKNPYSATKAGGEELCMAYENTYQLPIIVTHTMNINGKRQHTEKFIPIISRKI
jgi:hypothetical protein